MTDTPITPAVPTTPPGWYADPNSGVQRWWDGQAWTEHFAKAAPVKDKQNGLRGCAVVLLLVAIAIVAVMVNMGRNYTPN